MLEEVFSESGTTFSVEDNAVVLRFGSERRKDTPETEFAWIWQKLAGLTQQFPEKKWGLVIDFSKLQVQSADTISIDAIIEHLLQSPSASVIAILSAARSYQVAIRRVVMKGKAQTGRIKFFEKKEMALEWLKLKSS
ncbi:MAG: hypothetical protein Q8Q20_01315 [bacterium]|nr:hypothetical protein [bacterium]